MSSKDCARFAQRLDPSLPFLQRSYGWQIEQCFGWGKSIGPIRQMMVRGLAKVDQVFTLTMAAYNLTRLRGLAGVRP